MVDLFCRPFVELIDRMRLEYANQQSIFDLPRKKWYFPATVGKPFDLSVRFHDRLAGNPVGPASGPQSQMAQNLVLSWLSGARIMELKTVQVDDRLQIPRPCIDATNVGYNVEWSQELLVPDSLDQYVQGAMLIHMLRDAPDQFGSPFGDVDFKQPVGETIYDMSIGYDLTGIRSDKIRQFISGMIDATPSVERLRSAMPSRLGRLRDLDYPTRLSSSVTLSTFHGCPADEIERICEFLLSEMQVDVIVKMNPPMLGKLAVEHLLYDVMGYGEITVDDKAYSNGLQFDESIQITRRLTALAKSHGLHFGAKFSNTLEVVNRREFFGHDQKIMYLSGPPLHVITLVLADEYRRAVGRDVPISFSAGVDRKNFVKMVACGFTPITTCTDLLKTGGYGRLPAYLHELEKAMADLHVNSIDEFILAARHQDQSAGGDVRHAGILNTSLIAEETHADPRYHHQHNDRVPRRIDSHLVVFDCITCNKCIPVCPNDANFTYETKPVDIVYRDLIVGEDQAIVEHHVDRRFTIERTEQIANFADYCNHCGNCDTFCPEYDGPYLEKPSFFGSRDAYLAGEPHDGFYLEGRAGSFSLTGRIRGSQYILEQLAVDREYRFDDGSVCVRTGESGQWTLDAQHETVRGQHVVDVGVFHTMVALLSGITCPTRIHPVNTPYLIQ